MGIIGLDLHKRASQRSIKAEDGSITDRRIATSRERFTGVLGGRPRARILLEASTESEWVARHLESLGHEVIVADPNYGNFNRGGLSIGPGALPRERRRVGVGVPSAPLSRLVGREHGGPSGGRCRRGPI